MSTQPLIEKLIEAHLDFLDEQSITLNSEINSFSSNPQKTID